MSNIMHKTTTAYSAIAANVILILFLALLASISALNIPSFSQEQNNNDDNHAIVLSGRVNSMLMPTMADTNNTAMNNSATTMSQVTNNSTTATVNDTSAASQAMMFSMARDIAWLLSGDWVLTAGSSDSNTTTITFDAEFIKVTTNGTMLHTHRITNFVPLTNFSDISTVFYSKTNTTTIMGKADVYFNDELVWPHADTTLSIINGTVLIVDIDSEDVDDHFHNQPIYGTVSMLSKEDGFTITLPAPRGIQDRIEQELAELGANATQAQSAIETKATQAGRTLAEESMDIFNNVTDSIRQLFG
jgi:hypothetical protein